jgi:hypothetical protein
MWHNWKWASVSSAFLQWMADGQESIDVLDNDLNHFKIFSAYLEIECPVSFADPDASNVDPGANDPNPDVFPIIEANFLGAELQ